MQDVPGDALTWSQIATAAGVFLGGALFTIVKLMKAGKAKDDDLVTVGENARIVALAKENADLKAQRLEDAMRHELVTQIFDVKQTFAEAMRAGREAFHTRLDTLDGKVSNVQASVATIEGILSDRLPKRPR